MEHGPIIALAKDFQPFLASIVAVVAAFFAYLGATAGTRYAAKQKRRDAKEARWQRLFTLEDEVTQIYFITGAIYDAMPHWPQTKTAITQLTAELQDVARKLDGYSIYAVDLSPEVLVDLRILRNRVRGFARIVRSYDIFADQGHAEIEHIRDAPPSSADEQSEVARVLERINRKEKELLGAFTQSCKTTMERAQEFTTALSRIIAKGMS